MDDALAVGDVGEAVAADSAGVVEARVAPQGLESAGVHGVLVRECRAVRQLPRDVQLAIFEQVESNILRDLDVRVGRERDFSQHTLGITPMRRVDVLVAEEVAGLVCHVLGELAGVRLWRPPDRRDGVGENEC